MDNIEADLRHYVSEPYDPVKAHEYYMKNRELTGRKEGGLSDQQKEAWAYTKDQITTEKTAMIDQETAANQQKVEELKAQAAEAQQRITDKIQLYATAISEKAAAERARISDNQRAAIDALGEIPKGLSPSQRAVELGKRKVAIETIMKDASSAAAGVQDASKNERDAASATVSAERTQVRTDLKTVLDTTKAAFTEAKAKLDAGYETTFQEEYDKILATVPGGKAKTGKSSGKGSGASVKKAAPTAVKTHAPVAVKDTKKYTDAELTKMWKEKKGG